MKPRRECALKTLRPRQGVLPAYLGRMPLLKGLAPDLLERLSRRSLLRLYERGEVLFHQGEPSATLVWVAHGAIRVYRRLPDGRDKVIHLHSAPTLVAEVPTLLCEPRPASASCTEPCTVVLLERDALLSALASDPEISLHLLAQAMARLRELTRIVEHQGHLSALQRVAAYLAGLAQEHPKVVLPASKKDVASYLGLTPESLSRALASLRKAGIISTTDDGIVLEDRAGLEAVLQG